MSRAGREPAEDVKRRLVAACQEVGLVVNTATMHLSKEHGVRLVHVEASVPDWPHDTGMLTVMAQVSVAGNGHRLWISDASDRVRIRSP